MSLICLLKKINPEVTGNYKHLGHPENYPHSRTKMCPHLFPWLPFPHSSTSLEDLPAFISLHANQFHKGCEVVWTRPAIPLGCCHLKFDFCFTWLVNVSLSQETGKSNEVVDSRLISQYCPGVLLHEYMEKLIFLVGGVGALGS